MNKPDPTINQEPDSTDLNPSLDATSPATLSNTPDPMLEMMGFALRSALEEIAAYKELIDSAKTQAKRDLYLRKIKNTTKRLRRLLPAN